MFYLLRTDQTLNRPRKYFLVLISALVFGQTSLSSANQQSGNRMKAEVTTAIASPLRCADLMTSESAATQPTPLGLVSIYTELNSTAQKLVNITKPMLQPQWILDVRFDNSPGTTWGIHRNNIEFNAENLDILGHWDGEIISIQFKNTSSQNRFGWAQRPDYVFAHEYGHAVFQANAKRLATSLAKMSREEIEFIVDLDDSYDELFADTLAVLYSGDPEAMANESENRLHRSFSKKIVLTQFSNDIIDPHERLDPVRSYLWDNFMSGPRKLNPSQLLKMLLAARDAEMDYILKNKENIELNNQILNRRFIDALEKIWAEMANQI